ncbi:type III PLP-dependent enzyme [Microbispora sp. CA-135349]|uniref:type III PLP-dependent enzyme n=1 Tax=Microbispora sp. CA-135349 TaxID=3239953 RepID=UPI003D8A06F5
MTVIDEVDPESHGGIDAMAGAAIDYELLAAEYGTPLFVYDGDRMAGSLAELCGALPEGVEVFFSLKSNPNISVVSLLSAHGARAEVSSLAELHTALAAGVAPGNVIFLGPGKSEEEIEACVAARIYAVVVESLDELADVARLAAAAGIRQRVLLRVNPSRPPRGAGLTMGGKPRPFGIDEEVLLAAGDLARRYPDLDVAGTHAYLGTRILDAETVVDNTRRALDLAERVAAATGVDLSAVDVGGGLGVAYFHGESDPDLQGLREGLEPVVSAFRARHPGVRLLFESGRYLTARAGTYVVRVRYVKSSMGVRFAVVDGGTNHHMAAVGVGSFAHRDFPIVPLTDPSRPATGPWNIAGPLCTPNDTLGKNVTLPDLRPGDLLGVERSGAYGPTASPGLFLSHGFPAEVLVHEGRARLVRRRDTPHDLLRQQRHHQYGQ